MIAFKIREKEWMTAAIYKAGKLHKVLGYFFFFLSFLIVGTGIIEYFEHTPGKENYTKLGVLNFLVTFLVYAIAECCSRNKRFARDPFVVPQK
jgi:hypothetical protein